MTPQLRFPEFTDEWQVKKLGDVDVYVADGNYGEMYPKSSEMKDAGVPFIRANNLKNGKLIWQDMKYITPGQHQVLKSGHLKTNDILITTRGDIGITAFVTKDFDDANINAQICLLRTGDNLISEFVFQTLQTRNSKKQVMSLQTGSALKQLPKGKLALMKFGVPSKPEQEKIADFLTAVDERIGVSEKKLELLETYKRSVMQKIFSQQVRFKDENGNDYPEWEEKKIEDLYLFIWTNSLSRENLAEQGGYKNVHYGDIHTKFSNTLDTTKEKIPYINRAPKMLIERYIPLSILKTRDIVMADASEDYADIGKATEIVKTEGSTVAGLHTFVLRPYEKIALGFGAYLFSSDDLRREIRKIATGASVLGISKSNLSQLTISLPSIKEQQKIATLLTALDDKITAEKSKLSTTRQFKKALLQRMFV